MIAERPIETQEGLPTRLHEVGADAIRTTIPQGIREMKLVRSQNENRIVCYTLFNQPSIPSNEERLRTAARRGILRVQSVQFMVIVLTGRNGADAVMSWLDEVACPEVVGTIAGIDTFVVIHRPEKEARRFAEKLEKMRE